MGYKYIILEGFGQTDRREYDLGLIEEWESKGVHPNDIEQFNKELKLPKSWKKVRYAGAVYPIKKKVNSQTGDSSEIAFWRKLVKLLYDDKYIIVPANGEGNLGYVLYHLLNRGDTEKVVLCNDSYTNRYTQDSIDRVYDYFCEHKRDSIELLRVQGYTFEWLLLSSALLLRIAREYQYYNTDNTLWEFHSSILRLPADKAMSLTDLSDYMRNNGYPNYDDASTEKRCTLVLENFLSNTYLESTKHELQTCLTVDCCGPQCPMKHSYNQNYADCGLCKQSKHTIAWDIKDWIDYYQRMFILPKEPELIEKYKMLSKSSVVFDQALLKVL